SELVEDISDPEHPISGPLPLCLNMRTEKFHLLTSCWSRQSIGFLQVIFFLFLSLAAKAQEAPIMRLPPGARMVAGAAVNSVRPSVAWPLRLSAHGKYLEQQNGIPFLLVADAGWEFMTQLSEQEALAYLDDREAKGFNSIEIRVIGHKFQANAP